MRNLMRTSYSTIVYEIRDFGLGIYDTEGDLLAEAPGLAIFTRSNDYALKNAIEFVGRENIEPGDVILLNYPYWSSAHTLDVAAFAPIYHEDTLVGFTAARIHWLDLKQKDAGYVLDSTDMHQEGIFFPCTKIVKRGELQQDIVNIIKFNSRFADRTVGDMLAQVSACVTGARRVEEIVNRHIIGDHPVSWLEMPLLQAQEIGVTAVFDEKYGDRVRVVSLTDFSKELCGGTHVNRAGDIPSIRTQRAQTKVLIAETNATVQAQDGLGIEDGRTT